MNSITRLSIALCMGMGSAWVLASGVNPPAFPSACHTLFEELSTPQIIRPDHPFHIEFVAQCQKAEEMGQFKVFQAITRVWKEAKRYQEGRDHDSHRQ